MNFEADLIVSGMSLFNFELTPTNDIDPWGEPNDFSLSWYALSFGAFHMDVGAEILFEYTPDWQREFGCRSADYMLAAFVRDVLEILPAALVPLPPFFAALVGDDALLRQLLELPSTTLRNDALGWHVERSLWTAYLAAYPDIAVLRIKDEIRISWDNTKCLIENKPAWTATKGIFTLPATDFKEECQRFAQRLLNAMAVRIDDIESGKSRTQIALDIDELREQHQIWISEFSQEPFEYIPDVPWPETERSLRALAKEAGISLSALAEKP